MYYGEIKKTDIANGPGVRVSLFVSGCRNHCKGCFNVDTWDFNYGSPFTPGTLNELVEALYQPYIAGLTILGGEPMEPENIKTVAWICANIKQIYPEKTIWLYTGYKYEDLKKDTTTSIFNFIDVLVDGPFIEDEKDISLKYRGSKNQRIIDVVASQQAQKIVEVNYENKL